MRFLFVSSQFCARASFRHLLADLPLPSASSYDRLMTNQFRSSYRGLAPHKFMPMLGVHKSFELAPSGPDALTRAAQFKRYSQGEFSAF